MCQSHFIYERLFRQLDSELHLLDIALFYMFIMIGCVLAGNFGAIRHEFNIFLLKIIV